MKLLLEATALGELLRAQPSRPLVRRLSATDTHERFTSVVCVGRLLVAARRENQARLMQDVVRLVGAIRVAPFDLPAVERFSKYRATLGESIEMEDAMVAAICAARDLTLVTRRPGDFVQFQGLKVEDWTT